MFLYRSQVYCPAPKRVLCRTTHVKRIKDAVGSKSREISAGFPSENKSEKLVFLEFSNTSLKWPIMLHVIQLEIVNTIVPLAFPSIRLDQSEVMNELREIKLLCFHFSTFLFQEKTIRKLPRALIPRSDCSFIPRSPFRVLKIANQSNLLSSQLLLSETSCRNWSDQFPELPLYYLTHDWPLTR